MDLNEYQKKAFSTCLPTCNNIVYMGFNLAGEVGELLSKLGKAVRHDQLHIATLPLTEQGTCPMTQTISVSDEEKELIKKEAGDVLWQLAGVCTVMGWSLGEVAEQNLSKWAVVSSVVSSMAAATKDKV